MRSVKKFSMLIPNKLEKNYSIVDLVPRNQEITKAALS